MRVKIVVAVVAVILLMCSRGLYGMPEQYHFRRLGIEDGMSQNTVLSILQDRKGFMWFGTKDGLSRYDGARFKLYTACGTDGNLPDGIINALCETDDGRIWIGTDRGVCVYDPRTERFSFLNDTIPGGISVTDRIRSIYEDRSGKIWIASEAMGVFYYDPAEKKLVRPKASPDEFVKNPVAFLQDSNGVLWVGTDGEGLFAYNPVRSQFESFTLSGTDFKKYNITSFLESGRELYLGTFNDGLFRLNKEEGVLYPLLEKDCEGNAVHIRTMIRTTDDEIWMGGEGGLFIYDENSRKLTCIQQSYTDRYSLSDNAIYSFCKDRTGGLWIGTFFGGVNYLYYQHTPFYQYYPLNDKNCISGKAVREFCEDAGGNIWIGTEDAGLNCYEASTGRFRHIRYGDGRGIKYHNVHGLQIDGNKLWIGMYMGSVDVMDLETGRIKHYLPGERNSRAPADVFSILKDRTGKVWLGSFDGVSIYREKEDDFVRMEQMDGYFIYDIREDVSGNIWFAVFSAGVIRYNPVTGDFRHFNTRSGDSSGLVSDKIISMFCDSKGRFWLTSEGNGFCRFDEGTEKFIPYTVADGLPNGVVYCMTEDKAGNLWFGTNKGLVRFIPESGEMKVFTQKNGLLSDQFNYKSAYTAKDGTVYLGTVNGFIAFNPSDLQEDIDVRLPLLTGFQIFNREVEVGDNSPLKESVVYSKGVNLRYDENTLSFDFASLNYHAPEQYRYAYRLDGVDKEWMPAEQLQKITYSDLPPGKYTLRIRIQGEKEGEECRFDIEITPPFWLSPYAYVFYLLLLMAGVYGLIYWSNRRVRAKHLRKMELFENEKEKEVFQAKIEFFTNVAHEVRTPLSLIKAPLDHLLKEGVREPAVRDDLLIMQRNTDRLLHLINQLLDFRKTEAGKFSLTFVRLEVSSLLKGICQRFEPVFRQNQTGFCLQMDAEHWCADVDAEALTKIISNLLSNASKFAASWIKVRLDAGDADCDIFRIVVENDGRVIPEEMFEKVFEPFYRMDEDSKSGGQGTGIGLPLARTLAELHGGRLFLERQSADYNTFVLELRTRQEHTIQISEEEDITEVPVVAAEADQPEKYCVLIVDDHAEMRNFLSKQLKSFYNMFVAVNGIEALKVLDEEHIDLIVSDVMMPEMDGYEFLKRVKSDVKYSHVPFILLTAKTNLQSKIEGLESGADAYMEKPFVTEYLLVQISSLLAGRKKLRDAFMMSPYLHSNTIALTKADEQFMERLNEVVEQNLSNIDFGIDQLAGAMNTSRSSLLRKIKGISELTVNEYIRLVRLKKAAVLLEEGTYRINEICFLTGFNSSSYFAKCFQKQFGVLPKDFANMKKDRKEE